MLSVGDKRKLKASGLVFYVIEIASSASYFTVMQTDVRIRFRFDRKCSAWIPIDDVEKESELLVNIFPDLDETDPNEVLESLNGFVSIP